MAYGLLLLVIGLPVLLSALFLARFQWSRRDWKQLVRVFVFVSIPFAALDMVSVQRGWWNYNPAHVGPLRIGGLPLEELLFFFVIPFACLYLYSALMHAPRRREAVPLGAVSPFSSLALLWLLVPLWVVVGVGIWLSIVQPLERTVFDAVMLGAVLVSFVIIKPPITHGFVLWMGCITMLFIATNTILTALPIVVYAPEFGSVIRLGTIPVEDFLYNISLLLLAWIVWTHAGRYPRAEVDHLL